MFFIKISPISLLSLTYFFAAVVAETFMISRTKAGDIIRTDLSKPDERWQARFRSEEFVMVKREHWLARDPELLPKKLATPVRNVMIMSTETELCTTISICTWQVRLLQSRNLHELLPYNFMIGGDGHIYEGRGWDYQGAHPTNGYKIGDTISVAYLGTNSQGEPTSSQVALAQKLLSEGVREGKLVEGYHVHAVFNTRSGNIIPQAATVICENMHDELHMCTSLHANRA